MGTFLESSDSSSQMWLFARSFDDIVRKDCDVRAFKVISDKFDYSTLESSYSAKGRQSYPARMMVKLLVYAYSKCIRSSRQIEDMAKHDVRFLWLCDSFTPDHNTIARFRKDKWEHLNELFAQSIRLCADEGLVSLQCVSVDGSKFEANASMKSVYNKKRVEESRAFAEKLLQEAESIDESESNKTETSPEKIKTLKKAAKAVSNADKAEELMVSSERKSVSVTDSDCRIMKSKNGKRPCFNVQMAVDTSTGVIVSSNVITAENDYHQLPAVLDSIHNSLGSYPDLVLADAGYCDDVNFGYLRKNDVDALIPVNIHKSVKENANDPFSSKKFKHCKEKDVLICPAKRELTFTKIRKGRKGMLYREYIITGCKDCKFCKECCKNEPAYRRRIYLTLEHEFRGKMKERMLQTGNKQLFKRRKETIEPTFGNIKENYGLRRFMLRGLAGAISEIMLISIVINMRKVIAHLFVNRLLQAFIYIKKVLAVYNYAKYCQNNV